MLEEYRARILTAIGEWNSDKTFTLKQLLGDQWPTEKRQAITLGTEFRQAVENEFPDLEVHGEDGRNHERYSKR